MYHVELRQFPHTCCRFNLEERELRDTLLSAWARGDWVELGERRWSPHQARLTVLHGPRLSPSQLAMGRGWRSAQHSGKDVTEKLIAAARVQAGVGRDGGVGGRAAPARSDIASVQGRPDGAPEETPAGSGQVDANESPATQLSALLGDDADALLRAWQLALERHPDRTPSECLALAEALVRG